MSLLKAGYGGLYVYVLGFCLFVCASTATELSCEKWREDEFIFLHVPKTGGTSLGSLMDDFLHARGRRRCHVKSLEEKTNLLPKYVKDPSCALSGHFEFGAHEGYRPCSYVTMLRDPLERQISNYFYLQARPHLDAFKYTVNVTASQWIGGTTGRQQVMVQWICGVGDVCQPGRTSIETLLQAKQNIEECFPLVGITELFNLNLVLFKKYFPEWATNEIHAEHKNIQKRSSEDRADKFQCERFRMVNVFDQLLFEWAVGRLATQLEACGIPLEKDQYDHVLKFTDEASGEILVRGKCGRQTTRDFIYLQLPYSSDEVIRSSIGRMAYFYDRGICSDSEEGGITNKCIISDQVSFGVHRHDSMRAKGDTGDRPCSYVTVLSNPFHIQLQKFLEISGTTSAQLNTTAFSEFLRSRGSVHQEQVARLCGTDVMCRSATGMQHSFETALRNIEACFPVVGIAEEMDLTRQVLHRYYPQWFPETPLSQLASPDLAEHLVGQMPADAVEHFKSTFEQEFELYSWAQERLHEQARNCDIESRYLV